VNVAKLPEQLGAARKAGVAVYGHHHLDYMREAAEAIGRKPFRSISALGECIYFVPGGYESIFRSKRRFRL
jgi:hypothetical protein